MGGAGEGGGALLKLGLSAEEFENLCEGHPDGLAMHRGHGLLYVNRTMAAHLGYSDRETLIGRPVLDFVHPEDRERAKERMQEAMHTRGFLKPQRYRCLRLDDSIIELSVLPLRIEYGGEETVLLFLSDETERKKQSVQMLLNDRLANLGLVAAGVVHEMNNPLTYAQLQLSLLQRKVVAALDGVKDLNLKEVAGNVDIVATGLGQIATILGDLRTFSLGADEAREIQLATVLESSLKVASYQIPPEVRVTRDYQKVPMVRGSEPRLMQVFLNLVLNAAQALVDDDCALRVAVYSQGEQVIAEVIDNGCGIAPHIRARLFEPFFTTKDEQKGTGLGLWICQEIVTSLDGEIEILDAPGGGTCVRVSLPAVLDS
jgi:two-component system NtrC family sensor kinase